MCLNLKIPVYYTQNSQKFLHNLVYKFSERQNFFHDFSNNYKKILTLNWHKKSFEIFSIFR